MYKFNKNTQMTFSDFNQPLGLKMNESNRWIKKAELIPWEKIEVKYAKLFTSDTGMPAKPLRMALGSLLIQKRYGYSDEELVEQLRENPYYQYFIGMPGYEDKYPFVPSLLVEFRKRLSENILNEVNEIIITSAMSNEKKSDGDNSSDHNNNDNSKGESLGGEKTENTDTIEKEAEEENSGTLIIDATCAPQNIEYPQDVNLLNECREKLEKIIDKICYEFNYYTPRMYRKNARKDYLSLAKCKKRSAKRIRKAVKQQLQYVRRDLRYVDEFLDLDDVSLTEKQSEQLEVIRKVYEQQLFMYENKTHSVENRIVSISQPFIRPIVRGKARTPVEFGAKLDLSVDEYGMTRVEKLSFDAYNESEVLVTAVENYKNRTGHYPERVLVDKIYRNRENLNFCKEHGIRVSGKRLGRPKQHDVDKKTEYKDNTDRIEVERKFSLAKRNYGLGLLYTKLKNTTETSIILSIIAMNIDRLAAMFLRLLFYFLFFTRRKVMG